jgi:hypothetical protein
LTRPPFDGPPLEGAAVRKPFGVFTGRPAPRPALPSQLPPAAFPPESRSSRQPFIPTAVPPGDRSTDGRSPSRSRKPYGFGPGGDGAARRRHRPGMAVRADKSGAASGAASGGGEASASRRTDRRSGGAVRGMEPPRVGHAGAGRAAAVRSDAKGGAYGRLSDQTWPIRTQASITGLAGTDSPFSTFSALWDKSPASDPAGRIGAVVVPGAGRTASGPPGGSMAGRRADLLRPACRGRIGGVRSPGGAEWRRCAAKGRNGGGIGAGHERGIAINRPQRGGSVESPSRGSPAGSIRRDKVYGPGTGPVSAPGGTRRFRTGRRRPAGGRGGASI